MQPPDTTCYLQLCKAPIERSASCSWSSSARCFGAGIRHGLSALERPFVRGCPLPAARSGAAATAFPGHARAAPWPPQHDHHSCKVRDRAEKGRAKQQESVGHEHQIDKKRRQNFKNSNFCSMQQQATALERETEKKNCRCDFLRNLPLQSNVVQHGRGVVPGGLAAEDGCVAL